MATTGDNAVQRWSAALCEVEVLEPWLTESHWDEHYWDDVATEVVNQVGQTPAHDAARSALRSALSAAFPSVGLESDNGVYRDGLDRRVDLIVALALGGVWPAHCLRTLAPWDAAENGGR